MAGDGQPARLGRLGGGGCKRLGGRAAVNDMITVTEKHRAAQDNHVLETVLYLLLTVAVGALGFIAYGYGLMGQRRHGSTAIFAVLIALVLAIILDLDRPRRGLIRIGEDNMLRLQATLEQNTS
jgi:hypothetical protein